MLITKRDGTLEEFNWDKIDTAITKAFHATDQHLNEDILSDIKDMLFITNDMSVEDIQDQIENALFDCGFYQVGKAFIRYRDEHALQREYADHKIAFIEKYKQSENTANATIDDNSNVANHNIAVLNSEIHKEDNQITNLRILERKVKELYPTFPSKQMFKDFETVMYLHDSSSQIGMPYCVAISLYPFLLHGLKDIGGLSAAPKNIDSFCGMFVNLVFAISGQFKGAVATPGVFLCMDHFLRKEWGDDYYQHPDEVLSSSISRRTMTIEGQIHQYFQQICYSLMQPAAARGSQAVFWNCSIFDKPFFETMYGDFVFPDMDKPKWESLNWLQKNFMHWLNQERLKCILTFPVTSLCLIYQENHFLDQDLADFAAQEYAEGNSFFTYISDSADSLSSCCRLSSKLAKPQFSFTNGQLSEMTGSKNVITLNLSRIGQDYCRRSKWVRPESWTEQDKDKFISGFKDYLISVLDRVYKYQTAYNECLKDLYKAKLLSVYDAGFISMNKQYLTVGINALNQLSEFLGIQCNNNPTYKWLCSTIFSLIKEQNIAHKTKELMFNTEFTPCESAAIKLYNRDKKDGYWVPSDTNLYASYIFKPNDPNISVLDKFILHGNEVCGDNLDGGSAAHINLSEHLSKEQYTKLLSFAAQVGCKYFTFNIPNCECEECGFIAKTPFDVCPKCGSQHVSLWDRVIGYLTKIKNWSSGRQQEQKTRVYHKSI